MRSPGVDQSHGPGAGERRGRGPRPAGGGGALAPTPVGRAGDRPGAEGEGVLVHVPDLRPSHEGGVGDARGRPAPAVRPAVRGRAGGDPGLLPAVGRPLAVRARRADRGGACAPGGVGAGPLPAAGEDGAALRATRAGRGLAPLRAPRRRAACAHGPPQGRAARETSDWRVAYSGRRGRAGPRHHADRPGHRGHHRPPGSRTGAVVGPDARARPPHARRLGARVAAPGPRGSGAGLGRRPAAARLGGHGVFGALALRLWLATAGASGLVVCSGCGDLYERERRPAPSRGNYCPKCGIRAAWRTAWRTRQLRRRAAEQASRGATAGEPPAPPP